ncbi:TolC family protein [Candidatus Laterigemmans baculatus]|uniref:TolC family protein n=1 Tax=Candidatus Laterigemmans baculatus TaxID=2770505 RepID=UPI001F31D8BA|nr:TolC family protein [Candidatus Laterigemmans baculatus]
MKRPFCYTSVFVSLALVGCASPSAPLGGLSTMPAGAAGASPTTASIASRESAAVSAPESNGVVSTVTFQDESAPTPPRRQLLDEPAITPERPYSSTEPRAPVESGNVFLPVPAIPPTPSVAWELSAMAFDGQPIEVAPLTLTELEAIACRSNPTLLQARAQVQGALGKAIQAGLWPNPTLIYQAEQIGLNDTPGEFHGGLVRQRIVTAHKLDLSREKFMARTRTAEWVALAQQYRVLNDVRIHYFRARGRQEVVEVQRELLKNAEDHVVTFREMYNVGQATRAEVHQANVRLQNQRLNLLMAENDFRQAFEELTALSGVDLPSGGLETPLRGELELIDYDQALDRLLQESPQIGAARSKLEADRLTIRREIAEPVPDIIVEGGAGYNFVDRQTVAAAGVMMEVPVFDWNQGTIRQAEADYSRQVGELRRTELVLRQQLAQQYRNYLTAVQQVRNYEQVILPEAKLAYDLRLQSYEDDRAPWTDVLQAEQDYFTHRVEYIRSLIIWRESEVSIMGFLLHGGLADPPNPTPPGHIDAVPQPR